MRWMAVLALVALVFAVTPAASPSSAAFLSIREGKARIFKMIGSKKRVAGAVLTDWNVSQCFKPRAAAVQCRWSQSFVAPEGSIRCYGNAIAVLRDGYVSVRVISAVCP